MKLALRSSATVTAPLPMRAMSAALLLEGVLLAAVVWIAHQHLSAGARAEPQTEMITLVAPPQPAPKPMPPIPQPQPKPAPMPPSPAKAQSHSNPKPAQPVHVAAPVQQMPQPAALDHSAATVPSVESPPPPAQPPAPPTHAGPSPTDLFAAKLRAAIQSAVVYPFALREMALSAQVQVQFVYLDGQVSEVHVVQAGKVATFDRAAVAAVLAAPMPPAPAELAGHAHTFTVTVDFSFG